MDDQDMAKRIKELRLAHGLTLEQVANEVGVGKSTVRKWETGIIANMRRDKIASLAKALHTTPAYLMGWTDEPSSMTDAIPYHPNKRIPVLGRIAAGLPLYAEQNIESYMSIELPDDGEYFALIARGDSMDALGIKDGYTLIVRRQNAVDDGDVAVVLVDGEDATVKRFYQSGNRITLMPQSTNPKHMPQIYDTKKIDICVQGKVAKVLFNL